MRKNIGIISYILLITAIIAASLYKSEYFIAVHDQVQPERVFEMAGTLMAGQFPPRIVANLGYGFGYPLFNFYAPFPYYIGALLYISGVGLINATKIMALIGLAGAGLSMYCAASRLWGRKGGVVAAMLYLTAPYHAVQLYVRGSIGELYAYALLPLIVIGIIELYKKKPDKQVILGGMFGLTALALSHTISLYMTMYISLIYFLCTLSILFFKKYDVKKLIIRLIVFYLVPLLLSAYFWVPALTEIPLTQLSTASGNNVNFRDHFIELQQLWSSPWGYGGSAPGVAQDGMSFMIGKIAVLLSLVSIIFLGIKRGKNMKQMVALGTLGLLSVAHMLSISNIVWNTIPYFQLIQFPWRFLILTNLAVALLAPGAFEMLSYIKPIKYRTVLYFSAIITITITSLFSFNTTNFLALKFFNANGFYKKNQQELIAQTNLRYEASKISDEYLPAHTLRPDAPQDISYDHVECSNCTIKDSSFHPGDYRFTIEANEDELVYLDKAYFPRMQVIINGKQGNITSTQRNKLEVRVHKGRSSVIIKVEDTQIRFFANSISSLAIVGVGGYYLLLGTKRRRV